MKHRVKTILFLVVTLYIVPGIVIFWLDKRMLLFYLFINSSIFIPYLWSANKKRSCKFLGIEFKF